MKKILSLILLLIMIFSATSMVGCDSETENPDTSNESDIVEGSFGSFKNIDTENSYLGYGINIIDASAINSKNLKMEHPIFSPSKLVKEPLKKVKDHDSVFEYIESDTIEGFCQKMSNSVSLSSGRSASAKGKVEGIDIGASFSFSNGLQTGFKRTDEAVTSQYFLRMMSENRSYWLILQSDEANYKNLLSEEFESELYSSEPADLFKKYGTHLLLSVAMGGYIHMDYSMYSNSNTTEKENYTKVAGEFKQLAEVGFGDAGVSSGSENSYETVFNSLSIKEKYGINVERKLSIAGGKFTGINSETSFFENYAEWQQSLDEEPVLMGIRDEESLYPIWKLIDSNDERNNKTYTWMDKDGNTKTGTRAEQLEAYFVRYGLEQYDKLCSSYRIEEYIPIYEFEDLNKISENPNETFKLMNDINCDGQKFITIKEFSGKLDGNNHKIYNFKINEEGTGAASIGFIGINNGIVRNLTIGDEECNKQNTKSVYYSIKYSETSAEKKQALNVGVIAAQNKGTIENCNVINVYIDVQMADKNNNATAELYLGGISGRNDTGAQITNCKVNKSEIKGYMPAKSGSGDPNLGYLGGICSLNYGFILETVVVDSILNLDVRGSGKLLNKAKPAATIGGLVGQSERGKLFNCVITGDTTIKANVSGDYISSTINGGTIVGFHTDGSEYESCYSQEDISVVKGSSTSKALIGNSTKAGCKTFADINDSDLPDEIKKLLSNETND